MKRRTTEIGRGPDTRTQERIEPFVTPSWWQGPRTYIEGTAVEARKRHLEPLRQETAAVHIYTDGSGINRHIGAAAVCPMTRQNAKQMYG